MKAPEEMKSETELKTFTVFNINGIAIYVENTLLNRKHIQFTISRIGNFTIETD